MRGMPKDLMKLLRKKNKSVSPNLKSVFDTIEKDRTKFHKFGAERTVCLYKHIHDSKKEAMWCVKLHELEKEGKISLLNFEPLVVLKINDVVVCNHYPDFFYFDFKKQKNVLLDVKGMLLPEWKLKYKLCKAIYPNLEYVVV